MTSAPRQQCGPEQLWYPGLHLDDEYPTPTDQQLATLWEQYNENGAAQPLAGAYGVFTPPQGTVRAIASIDLCEVMRDTVMGLHMATGMEPTRRSYYTADAWFHRQHSDHNYEESVIVSTVRTIMNEGLIQPVEHIEAIAAMLRNWRVQGVYVVANTSTLPGCEPGTIAHTLGRYLHGCFDGLVLPRNHDGTGTMTKAHALELIAAEAGITLTDVPFVHIDDAPWHMQGFLELYGRHHDMGLFVPSNPDNAMPDTNWNHPSTFEAVLAANRYLKGRGVFDETGVSI